MASKQAKTVKIQAQTGKIQEKKNRKKTGIGLGY
jgi:hypothetical protein